MAQTLLYQMQHLYQPQSSPTSSLADFAAAEITDHLYAWLDFDFNYQVVATGVAWEIAVRQEFRGPSQP